MDWEYSESFKIRGYEVDEAGHVPVQTLCAFMEEAAHGHADRLGLGVELLQGRGITWVLARMHIKLCALPASTDTVVVKTWPVEVERLQFRRDFHLTDGKGREFLRAVTEWVIIDLETRRLQRIPEFVSNHRPANPERILAVEKLRIEGQENAPELKRFVVRKADIDRNRHVNNVRFTDWMLEAVPDEISAAQKLCGLQIIYRAEALYGDTVIARGGRGGSGEFLHGLYRLSDGQELVRARSFWK